MDVDGRGRTTADRIVELLALYSSDGASVADLFCDRHDPARIACSIVRHDLSRQDVSYGELRAESEQLAAGLAELGLRQGDRVATLMGKTKAYLVSLLAIWRLGAVHVPLFTAFAQPAVMYRLRASNCKAVICDSTQQAKVAAGKESLGEGPWKVVVAGTASPNTILYADLLSASRPLAPAVAIGGSQPFIQIYTSGTTGDPKGVAVPLRALASFQIYMEYGLGVEADDVYWNAADPGWAYGLYFGVVAPLAMGLRSILVEGGFSAEKTLSVLERLRVTNFAAAPTVFRALRAAEAELPDYARLRCASSAGEPLTPEVNHWAIRALGVPVYDHYGQTEAGMLVNNHQHPDLRRPLRVNSMGQAMPGWKAVVLRPDVDEPAGPNEMGRVAMDVQNSPLAWFCGYIDGSTTPTGKFSRDGRWYFTGDSGRLDADGYFYFSARDDDVIIMAGYRIGPCEVEAVLAKHPAIAESAVVAAPDAIRGEVLEAVVVLRPGHAASPQLSFEIQEWVKQQYAAHAYPRRVHFVQNLPKTPSGKMQRYLLRQQLREAAGRFPCA